MKKILAVVLVTLMFLFQVAVAEESVYSKMSDEELLQAKIKIDEEISFRQLSKGALLISGIYTVGVDIPEGRYKFTFVSVDDSSDGWGDIFIFQDGESIEWFGFSAGKVGLYQTYYVDNSMTIKIRNATFYIEKLDPLFPED